MQFNQSPLLMVEDNALDRDLAARAFAASRIINPLVFAKDGEEAIATLTQMRDNQRLPVVVMLDLKLPKISGLEVLQFLMADEVLKHVPTIMLTSSSENSDINEAYAAGATSYMVKPVEFESFLKVAEVIKLHWCVFSEPRPQRYGAT